MRTWIKIILLLLAIFPVWLTILAMAEENSAPLTWKQVINSRLLREATEVERIQLVEISGNSKQLDEILPTEDFELDLSEIQNKGNSNISLRFKDQEGRLVRDIKISTKLLIERRVSVASRDISRAEILDAQSVKEEWISSSRLNDRIFNLVEILGKRTSRNLKAGQVIYPSSIEIEKMVNNGDRVKVYVVGNGLSIVSYGIAKESGARGQTIRILNPESKKEIYATVTDNKRVEVRL